MSDCVGNTKRGRPSHMGRPAPKGTALRPFNISLVPWFSGSPTLSEAVYMGTAQRSREETTLLAFSPQEGPPWVGSVSTTDAPRPFPPREQPPSLFSPKAWRQNKKRGFTPPPALHYTAPP
ncbi:unnamed protein product [Pleuronectes platessa]|uniref:Uncharacterized protein n=1 Tax=Pleuronectes platessa TaxID=8262 RepID=A0A9N7UIY5_PLEPL|nr:unnamed protein product [Pleuronectes platessa]